MLSSARDFEGIAKAWDYVHVTLNSVQCCTIVHVLQAYTIRCVLCIHAINVIMQPKRYGQTTIVLCTMVYT